MFENTAFWEWREEFLCLDLFLQEKKMLGFREMILKVPGHSQAMADTHPVTSPSHSVIKQLCNHKQIFPHFHFFPSF